MTNIGDFWGPRKEKKLKTKSLKLKAKEFGSFVLNLAQKTQPVFATIGQFFRRVWRLPRVLKKVDKIALIIFLVFLIGLSAYKFNRDFLSKTKKIPNFGGRYEETLVGEAKYLNPVLAKTDTDRTLNRLIYSGLTKVDSNGQIIPDLATSWEVSADGKNYTFHLRQDVNWQDGVIFSSADVEATILSIKDASIKSPNYDSWKDVDVETPDESTVIFHLPNSYGPFIYNTLTGIIPAHLDPGSISSSPVGTGPYKFSKVTSKNNSINTVYLSRFDGYYGQKPYINTVEFHIASDETAAKKMFEAGAMNALAGVKVTNDDVANYSFKTSRYFGLVFNLANDKFKDANLRKKIVGNDKIDPEISFNLLVLDKPLSVAAAQGLADSYKSRGININIDKRNAVDFQNAISKHNFEAVLYGFDSGYDRDPYPFWHSSQIESGENYWGFSDKNADILLEDARMTTDSAVRNQKYDQFYGMLTDQTAAIFLPAQNFDFSVKKTKGITTIYGFEPWDHLNGFENWYIKTKRVKP